MYLPCHEQLQIPVSEAAVAQIWSAPLEFPAQLHRPLSSWLHMSSV